MLFNSYTFVLIFLPITLGGYLLLRRWENSTWQVGWLTLASLVFYGWWNPPYLVLLLASIGVNYGIGCKLTGLPHRHGRQRWLTIGLVFNLALLAYFKYALFFLGNFNAVWGTRFAADQILLPLGISFFTFQQIAFLIDAYRGEVDKTAFSHYCLFVSFFPQLIAGPIVHHGELLPQLRHRIEGRRFAPWLATGVTLFTIGLFKKVVLADHLGSFVAPVFDAAASGQHLTMLAAWLGTLAYTFQLYFDFSGYSDMAIGLASLFGLRLPLNFNSPYKATNISDFWRRWHITLSRFLRDYLYIPLGGNRKGHLRRYVNLILTMLLGGLWHGAGWNFVLWGGLHGGLLAIHHGWRLTSGRVQNPTPSAIRSWLSRFLTLVVVSLCWVCFRAENLTAAIRLWEAMCGAQTGGPSLIGAAEITLNWQSALLWIAASWLIVWHCPNSRQVVVRFNPAEQDRPRTQQRPNQPQRLQWLPTPLHGATCAVVLLFVLLQLSKSTEFLYYQF